MSIHVIGSDLLESVPLALLVETRGSDRKTTIAHCVELRPRDGVIDYNNSGTVCRYETLNVRDRIV